MRQPSRRLGIPQKLLHQLFDLKFFEKGQGEWEKGPL